LKGGKACLPPEGHFAPRGGGKGGIAKKTGGGGGGQRSWQKIRGEASGKCSIDCFSAGREKDGRGGDKKGTRIWKRS